MSSDNKNTPEVLVTLFRDRPELLFAAGRILPRHDPDPGRKITTRPECLGSVTTAVMVVAPMTPIPGMVSSRLLASFERCCATIRFSIDPIVVCTA